MRHTFHILLSLLLFSSCSSTYFYSTINTSNEYLEKVENGDFLLETDSLWIAYCYKGESAPIQITVYNKLDRPLCVDWQRSALIINDIAYSYTGSKINVEGGTESYNYDFGYSSGNFSGTADMPRHLSFIPPKTMISHVPLRLNVNFEGIDKKSYRNSQMGDKHYNAIKVKRIDFDENNSPIHFKSYLTIYEKPEKPMVFENTFFISNLIKASGLSPKDLPNEIVDRGDLFYVTKPANNTFWEVFGVTAVVAGVVALDIAVDSNDRY